MTEVWRRCAAVIWRVADVISHAGTWCYERHRRTQTRAIIKEFRRK